MKSEKESIKTIKRICFEVPFLPLEDALNRCKDISRLLRELLENTEAELQAYYDAHSNDYDLIFEPDYEWKNGSLEVAIDSIDEMLDYYEKSTNVENLNARDYNNGKRMVNCNDKQKQTRLFTGRCCIRSN